MVVVIWRIANSRDTRPVKESMASGIFGKTHALKDGKRDTTERHDRETHPFLHTPANNYVIASSMRASTQNVYTYIHTHTHTCIDVDKTREI